MPYPKGVFDFDPDRHRIARALPTTGEATEQAVMEKVENFRQNGRISDRAAQLGTQLHQLANGATASGLARLGGRIREAAAILDQVVFDLDLGGE